MAVKIVSMHGIGSDTKYEFHRDAFKTALCKSTGDKIAIVSIFGEPNTGKTSLLNLILRYFTAGSQIGWLGEDIGEQSLFGFRFATGEHSESRGIWLSAEPIPITDEGGESGNVFLMDSKGTGSDPLTRDKEMAVFTAVSVQLSSYAIFNVSKGIGYSVLDELAKNLTETFNTSGRASNTDYPHFVFCVRDWENEGRYSYGPGGGFKYVQEVLTNFEQTSPCKDFIGSSLPNCSGVLLPLPDSGSKSRTYNGNIASLGPTFAHILDQFIRSYFDSDSLLSLALDRAECLRIFSSLSNAFHGQGCSIVFSGTEFGNALSLPSILPDPSLSPPSISQDSGKPLLEDSGHSLNILQSTKSAVSRPVIAHSSISSSSTSKDSLISRPGTSQKSELRHPIISQHYSISSLSTSNDYSISRPGTSQKSVLQRPGTSQDSVPIRPSISQHSPNFEIYIKIISNFESKVTTVNQTFNGSEAEFRKKWKIFIEEAIVDFTDSDLRGNFRDIRTEEDKLKSEMLRYGEFSLSEWKKDNLEKEEEIKKACQEALSLYKEEMEELCMKPNQRKATLKDHHKKNLQVCLDEFQEDTANFAEYLVQPHLNKLQNEMEEILIRFQDKLALQKVQRIDAAKKFAEAAAIRLYKDNLEAGLKGSCFIQEAALHSLHEKAQQMALLEFRTNIPYKKIVKVDTGELTSCIAELFQSYKVKNETAKRRIEEELSRISSSALEQYRTALDRMKIIPSVTMESFDSCNKATLAAVKLYFFSFENTANECLIKETWEKQMSEMITVYNSTSCEVQNIIMGRKATEERVAAKCVHSILQALKDTFSPDALQKVGDLKQLEDIYKVEKLRSIQSYSVETDGFDEHIKNSHLDGLKVKLETEFLEEIQQVFLLQSETSKLKLNEAQLHGKVLYYSEMAKKFLPKGKFYKPSDFLDIHLQIIKLVLTKFGSDLRPGQIQELRESLEPSYELFQRTNDMNTPSKSNAIGIDLGTTYSCVAVYHGGEVSVLRDTNGNFSIPSYVSYINGTEVVGLEAKKQAYIRPYDTVYDAKRILAKNYEDPTLQADLKNWSFSVVGDPDGGARIKLKTGGQVLPPERISAKILKSLKSLAEAFLKTPVTDAVITVPAYFNDGQRNATKDAGELAGFSNINIINEPTAAALAYFWEFKETERRNILVYDLGGGTFDVSVLTMEGGNLKVLAVGGDGHLGGEDFDHNMIDYCLEEFRKKTGVSLKGGPASERDQQIIRPQAHMGQWKQMTRMKTDPFTISSGVIEREKYYSLMRRLKNIVEDAKISLATTESMNIVLEALHGGFDLNVPITRTVFNQINQSLFDKTMTIVQDTLGESGLGKAEIDEVVLVGGSSRILKVKEMLVKYFERDLVHTVNADEAVARGAAIHAAILSGSREQKLQNISLEDVTPLSLGIGYQGDRFSVIIPRNTPVPVSKVETFYKKPDQRKITISVYEGEEPKTSQNHLLGRFCIDDLCVSKVDQKVEVTLMINKESILSLTAEGEGISKKFVIQKKGRMTEEDKRRYLQEEAED